MVIRLDVNSRLNFEIFSQHLLQTGGGFVGLFECYRATNSYVHRDFDVVPVAMDVDVMDMIHFRRLFFDRFTYFYLKIADPRLLPSVSMRPLLLFRKPRIE